MYIYIIYYMMICCWFKVPVQTNTVSFEAPHWNTHISFAVPVLGAQRCLRNEKSCWHQQFTSLHPTIWEAKPLRQVSHLGQTGTIQVAIFAAPASQPQVERSKWSFSIFCDSWFMILPNQRFVCAWVVLYFEMLSLVHILGSSSCLHCEGNTCVSRDEGIFRLDCDQDFTSDCIQMQTIPLVYTLSYVYIYIYA